MLDASRQIRTGNVQEAGDPLGEFQEILCQRLVALVECEDLLFDIRPFATFDAIDFPPFLDENGVPQGVVFDPGTAGQIMLVRVSYHHTFMTPLLGELLGEPGTNRRLVTSATAFRNEPFAGAPPD